MNCPISIKDIDMSQKVFKIDIGSLKGKTEKSKPFHAMVDIVKAPREILNCTTI